MSLREFFEQINQSHFEGKLEQPELMWNARLRSSAGRFFPGSRKLWKVIRPKIEIAAYLREEEKNVDRVKDTLAHEMIHLWLWGEGRPYGHTAEFLAKMREMGVSRYNPVPKRSSLRYLYECRSCQKKFPTRKRLGQLACAACCEKHAGGRFDVRFLLTLNKRTASGSLGGI